jgi:thiol-disulfide isomerase/thioredoxin
MGSDREGFFPGFGSLNRKGTTMGWNSFSVRLSKNGVVEMAVVKTLIFLTAMLLAFNLPASVDASDLFSKIGAKPIKNHKQAPNFCLEELNGEKVHLAAVKGKIIFLNFWATWCGPSREEMPSMEALYRRYEGTDFLFLTISIDGGREPVRKFIEKHRYRIPVLLDPAGETLELFEISRIPATLVIHRNGKIIGRVIGPRNWSRPEVFSLVDQTLMLP